MNTETYKNLQVGDKVLFNDRKQPLTVEELNEDRVLIEGSQGGEYQIYLSEDEENVLFSKRDSRRYASYCKDLRKVGEWKKEGNLWKHSKTDAKISLSQNEVGYWKIEVENIGSDLEQPKYGYSDKEEAIKDIEKVIRDNPEGWNID